MESLFGSSGRSVARIGLGTWNIESAPRKDAIAALRRGIELGLTHIDTAEMYGSGEAERIVGEAVAGIRDQVFLVSKVLPSNATRSGTIQACEQSLKRLGTDRLDCCLLHWRGRHPLAETVAAFEQLQHDGRILSWGVSNFDVGDLEDMARVSDRGRMVCNQVLYHLEERAIEHAVIPWCEGRNVAVVAYSPFGSGSFPKPSSPGGTALRRVAEARGATPRQIALAYLARNPAVFVIPKSAKAGHVEENAGAGDLALSAEEIELLDRAFPRGPKPRSLPMI
jgi:diketogulonate reductase-like aldo/keto reductase